MSDLKTIRIERILLRDVKDDDCHDLWVWRNDPNVRKNCFDSQEIKFEKHQVWFQKTIKDNDTKI